MPIFIGTYICKELVHLLLISKKSEMSTKTLAIKSSKNSG